MNLSHNNKENINSINTLSKTQSKTLFSKADIQPSQILLNQRKSKIS